MEGTLEHRLCPKLNRTLERSGQCAGVERLRDGRQICLKLFMRMESGQSVDDHDKRNLYERGDSPSEERAREHAPAGVINLGAGAIGGN